MAKHYPPAYRRYKENHPTVSVVLTNELKNFLDAAKSKEDLSYSALVRKFIMQGSDIVKAHDEGYAEANEQAQKKLVEAEKRRLAYGVEQYHKGVREGKVSDDVLKARQAAYANGYETAKKEYQIWYFCNVCRERIDIIPGDNQHEALIAFMKENGWGHSECH